MPTNDEELLISYAKKGNQEAFLLLDRRYRQKIINFMMRSLLLPREDCEDIFQEAFTRAVLMFEEKNKKSFKNWLTLIAYGYGINRVKKIEKYRNTKDSYREYRTFNTICVELNQENKMSDILNILRECLNEKHYEMIKLHYVEGYHWDELAGSFGYSSPDSASHAVRKALKNALSGVRRYLQED